MVALTHLRLLLENLGHRLCELAAEDVYGETLIRRIKDA